MEKKESWERFVSLFMIIMDKLGSYDQGISNEEKKTKILWTLPESFKPITMVCSITQISFNDVLDAMNAEIKRQQNVQNPSTYGQLF